MIYLYFKFEDLIWMFLMAKNITSSVLLKPNLKCSQDCLQRGAFNKLLSQNIPDI